MFFTLDVKAQDIFDTVVNHLRKQQQHSLSRAGSVNKYYGCNGAKCAIGCLIPEETYVPEMEGKTILSLLSCRELQYGKNWDWLRSLLKPHGPLLYDLQCIHDSYRIKDWEDEFKYKAKKYNLHYKKKV